MASGQWLESRGQGTGERCLVAARLTRALRDPDSATVYPSEGKCKKKKKDGEEGASENPARIQFKKGCGKKRHLISGVNA